MWSRIPNMKIMWNILSVFRQSCRRSDSGWCGNFWKNDLGVHVQFRSAMLLNQEEADACVLLWPWACKDVWNGIRQQRKFRDFDRKQERLPCIYMSKQEFIGGVQGRISVEPLRDLQHFEKPSVLQHSIFQPQDMLMPTWESMSEQKLTWDDYLKLTAADLKRWQEKAWKNWKTQKRDWRQSSFYRRKIRLPSKKELLLILSSRFEGEFRLLGAWEQWVLWVGGHYGII